MTLESDNKLEKWKIAQLCGISERTLRRWLNEIWLPDLKTQFGYRRNQKYLTREQIEMFFPEIIGL